MPILQSSLDNIAAFILFFLFHTVNKTFPLNIFTLLSANEKQRTFFIRARRHLTS